MSQSTFKKFENRLIDNERLQKTYNEICDEAKGSEVNRRIIEMMDKQLIKLIEEE